MQLYFDLVDHGYITAEQLLDSMRRSVQSRLPIGQLAVENEMMKMGQVFDVLAQQREDDRPFGQLAMEMGYLSRLELGELMLQQLDSSQSTIECLVDSGLVEQSTIDRLQQTARGQHAIHGSEMVELLQSV